MKPNDNKPKGGMNLMKGVLTVKDKTYLTPHYIRVVLEGDAISNYANAQVGDNNKIILPKEQKGNVVLPEKGLGGAGDEKPIVRTYTLRALDLEKGEMTLDFVAHGEEGPASRWAIHAEKGDQLGVMMKDKGKQLVKPADYSVFIGDHTALPVISVMLEQLPADAEGKAILEVYSEADVLALKKPENVEIVWVFNDEPGKSSALPHQVAQLEFPEGKSRFVFSAVEYAASKLIVQMLREYYHLERPEWRSSSYWKYGQTEEASKESRSEIAHRG